LCRFQHQQGVTPWRKQPCTTDMESAARKAMLKQVWPTRDKRTVRRRLARLRARASALGLTPWVSRVDETLPQLICRVGSTRLPATTNAIERFFRALQRFYATRGGFHSVLSATRALLLL
jgi:transposase-like protein